MMGSSLWFHLFFISEVKTSNSATVSPSANKSPFLTLRDRIVPVNGEGNSMEALSVPSI